MDKMSLHTDLLIRRKCIIKCQLLKNANFATSLYMFSNLEVELLARNTIFLKNQRVCGCVYIYTSIYC